MKQAFVSITSLLKRIDFLIRTGDKELADKLWEKLDRVGNVCMYLKHVDAPYVYILLFLHEQPHLEEVVCSDIIVNMQVVGDKVSECMSGKELGGPISQFLVDVTECVLQRISADELFSRLEEVEKVSDINRLKEEGVFRQIVPMLVQLVFRAVCDSNISNYVCPVILELAHPELELKGGGFMRRSLYHYSSFPSMADVKKERYSVAIISSNGEILLGAYNSPESLAYFIHNAGVSFPFKVINVGSVNARTASDAQHITKYIDSADLPEEWEWFDGMFVDIEDADGQIYRLVYFVE